MPKAKKLTLAVLINAALINQHMQTNKAKQKVLLKMPNGSVLFRTGFF